MNFEEIGVSPQIAENLKKNNITEPMIVQEKAIPLLMQGKDLTVRSKTGSGKTIAFLIPILQKLNVYDRSHVQALILEPTRELAVQVSKDLKMLDPIAKHVVLYGGVGIEPQIHALREGCPIVIGTPGRILDHLARGTLNLRHVRFVVLDEGDRMLDMGFIDDVNNILKATSTDRQTMLFSATMPDAIVSISRKYMRNPERLILEQDEVIVKLIKQEFYGCMPRQKLDALFNYMKLHHAKITKTLIFTNTKRWADSLSNILYKNGIHARAIHSDLSQGQRERVLDDFKEGRINILVATDVAARGLHIPAVSHVINYDIPKNAKDYIHRIGRTGRAGASGHAVSFLATSDTPFLRDIERETGQYIEVKDITNMIVPSRRQDEHSEYPERREGAKESHHRYYEKRERHERRGRR